MKINKNQPKNKGRARHAKKQKFKSSFAAKRTGVKITKKQMKHEKRQFSLKNRQNTKNQPKEHAVPEITHKQQRMKQKQQRQQSDSITKIQIEQGLKNNFSQDKLKSLLTNIKTRGLKQRLARKIANRFSSQ